MSSTAAQVIKRERKIFASLFLNRDVLVDVYVPTKATSTQMHLLLINDGQDLITMNFEALLAEVVTQKQLQPLLCVGVHAGENRRSEYGTAKQPDFGGRGAQAHLYNRFILEELLPLLEQECGVENIISKNMAGFSLGGLTAIDMVWNYPTLFSIAGVFSGSLWWRSKDLSDGYNEDTDRIMHQQIRSGQYHAGNRFYFTTGSLDETADRNNNGIIDSIDDTLALIEELQKKGYGTAEIQYINFDDGRHDVPTWERAMPAFLLWGWGKGAEKSAPFESC